MVIVARWRCCFGAWAHYLIRIGTVIPGLKPSGHLYAVGQKVGWESMEFMCFPFFQMNATSNVFPILVFKNDELDLSNQTHPTEWTWGSNSLTGDQAIKNVMASNVGVYYWGVVMPISNINWLRECSFAEGWSEMALLIYAPVNESKYLW